MWSTTRAIPPREGVVAGENRVDSKLRNPGYQGKASLGRGLVPRSFLREALEFEGGLQYLLGEGADDGLGLLAGLEESDGRDAGDAEGAGKLGLGVHVDLGDLERALVLGGDLVHNRGDLPTRAAPRGPEIDQYRDVRLQDLVLERIFRDCYRLRHVATSRSLASFSEYRFVSRTSSGLENGDDE